MWPAPTAAMATGGRWTRAPPPRPGPTGWKPAARAPESPPGRPSGDQGVHVAQRWIVRHVGGSQAADEAAVLVEPVHRRVLAAALHRDVEAALGPGRL